MGRPVGRPPEPCPQCGLLMRHEIALLVGQHLTCPPLTPDHERRAAATSALLALMGFEVRTPVVGASECYVRRP